MIEGLEEALRLTGHGFADISLLAHGTTLVTNAVIERKGATCGMIVTEGFIDVPDIARESRYELFDMRIHFAEPVVPRAARIEIGERIAYDGSVSAGVNQQELVEKLTALRQQTEIRSLAICLLNSYRNDANEIACRDIVRRHFPDLYLSVSSQVASAIKEYERWTTTLLNAYTQPLIDSYLSRLEAELTRRGFKGTLRIMTSSGGAFDPGYARELPVRLIESGPAAGILMAAQLAEASNLREILAFDIGGTTAKGAFIRDASPVKKYELEVAREHHFRPGSGLPVRVPVIDMMEIGSGGGSIARIDRRGLVVVGPTSASSRPGPACYDLGGTQPTLTDANLLLGFLDPGYFLGGRMGLSTQRASEAIESLRAQINAPSVEAAAEGIRDIAAEDVAAAFRTHAAELGLDVRRSTLLAFGGSGPVMATLVARKLRISDVLFPAGSGIFSAIGLLASPATFEVSRSFRTKLHMLDNAAIAGRFDAMRAEAAAALMRMNIPAGAMRFERLLDLRYVGQGHQVRIALPAESTIWRDAIRAAFEDEYRNTFSVNVPETDIETTDWRVTAVETDVAAPALAISPSFRIDTPRPEGTAQIWFGGKPVTARRLHRYGLRAGNVIAGPALIQEVESTCVLLPGDIGTVLPDGQIKVRLGEGQK